MGWAFLYMFAVLKIPVVLALGLVWWAVRERPAEADESRQDGEGGGGGRHPRPRRPRPPRRGPHAEPPLGSPPRVRAAGRRRVHARP